MTDRELGEQPEQPPAPASETSGPLGIGWIVTISLAVLTLVEFIIAVTVDMNLPFMIAFAVVKAALIVHYFMHLVRLWRGHEDG